MTLETLAREGKGGFWYLASPYTYPDPAVRHERAVTVNRFAGELMTRGIFVYSPIHASHQIACDYDLPSEFTYWEAFCRAFITPAAGIIIAAMPGWRDSRGVTAEIAIAEDLRKPVWLAHNDWQGFRVEKLSR